MLRYTTNPLPQSQKMANSEHIPQFSSSPRSELLLARRIPYEPTRAISPIKSFVLTRLRRPIRLRYLFVTGPVIIKRNFKIRLPTIQTKRAVTVGSPRLSSALTSTNIHHQSATKGRHFQTSTKLQKLNIYSLIKIAKFVKLVYITSINYNNVYK